MLAHVTAREKDPAELERAKTATLRALANGARALENRLGRAAADTPAAAEGGCTVVLVLPHA